MSSSNKLYSVGSALADALSSAMRPARRVRQGEPYGLLAIALVLFACVNVRADVSFMRDVAPVLVHRCIACHGERKDSGDYRAHTFESLMRNGSSDDAPIVPGKPESSLLLELITTKDADDRMPQKDEPLSAQQIEVMRQWIKEGAKFDGPDKSAPIKMLMGPRHHPNSPPAYRMPTAVMAMAFAPNGKELAVGGYHEVTVWDPNNGALLRRVQHLPQRIQALAYSSDGSQLLVAGGTPGDYGELCIADANGKLPPKVLETFEDIALAAAFSPDGKRIAVGGADQSVGVYDSESRKRIWTTKLHSDWVTGISFSADGRFVASSSKDMNVKVYEAKDGALFTSYTGHHRQVGPYAGQNPVHDVAFAPNSPQVMSAGTGRWIQIWEAEKARQEAGTAADLEERFSKQGHTRYIEHGFKREVLRLLPRPGQVFAAGSFGDIKLFDLTTQKEIRTFAGQSDWIFSLACNVSGSQLACGSADGRVCVWEVASGKIVANFYAAPGYTAQPRAVSSR